MNQISLDQLLSTARLAGGDLDAVPPPFPPGCLPFDRARVLALDPERAAQAEQAHAAACRRCDLLVREFGREVRHPSLWLLLRRRLGLLAGEEEAVLEYHLERAGCARCRDRLAKLETALPAVARFSGLLMLPNPAAASAATASSALQAVSGDSSLEAELFEEDHTVVLEVRTRNPELCYSLVGFTLRGAQEGEEEGFTVLGRDVDGWCSGDAAWDAEQLYRSLRGTCDEILVSPVPAGLLTGEERAALLASVDRSRGAAGRGRWVEWAARAEAGAEPLPEAVQRLLADVRERAGR